MFIRKSKTVKLKNLFLIILGVVFLPQMTLLIIKEMVIKPLHRDGMKNKLEK